MVGEVQEVVLHSIHLPLALMAQHVQGVAEAVVLQPTLQILLDAISREVLVVPV